MSGWARKHAFSSPAPQPAPNPKCSTPNQPTSHLGTDPSEHKRKKDAVPGANWNDQDPGGIY